MTRLRVPELPIEQWHVHPAWERQAYGPLVGFHDRYRSETSRLVAAAQDPALSPETVLGACAALRDTLHAHEAVEEHALYPFVERGYAVDFDELRAQHVALNRKLDELLVGRFADSRRPALRALLVELDRTLRAHLAAEEAICVPVLLETPADQFAELMRA